MWHLRVVEILFGAALCRRGSAPKARLTDNGPWFCFVVFISEPAGSEITEKSIWNGFGGLLLLSHERFQESV
jgi:hypothetical protein